MKPKSNSVVTVEQTDDGKLLFNVLGAGVLTFDPAKCDASMNAHAALHGWKQRISDAAAMDRDPETGRPASPADKLTAMQDLAEYYMGGATDWRRVGKGGAGKSITIEAIARVKSITYAEAEEYVDSYAARNYSGDRKECLAFLREGKRVMEAMAAIRAERAPKPKVDADAALDEFTA